MTDKPWTKRDYFDADDEFGSWTEQAIETDTSLVVVTVTGRGALGEHEDAIDGATATVTASVNAVRALASHLNRDPVALAKELEDGGLVGLFEAAVWTEKDFVNEGDGGPYEDGEMPCLYALRAILSRLRECGG